MEFPVLDFPDAIPLPRGVAKSVDFRLIRNTELYPVWKRPRRREPICFDLSVYCIFGNTVVSHFLFAVDAADLHIDGREGIAVSAKEIEFGN